MPTVSPSTVSDRMCSVRLDMEKEEGSLETLPYSGLPPGLGMGQAERGDTVWAGI